MATFYEQKMLRLFERYELPENARAMFKALEDFKTSRLDEAGLGRLIRLSRNNRSTLVTTMVKCANIMKDKPKEAKNCLIFITGCGKMLEIGDKPIQDVGFPHFIKLPRELRDRIYGMYLGNCHEPPVIIPNPKKGDCLCAPHEPPQYSIFPKVDLHLAFTSKMISNEVLCLFYRNRKFHFPCACEMGHHLSHNILLRSNIIRVMFHWCGQRADNGIRQLQGIQQLESITVVVSKTTSVHPTHRERDIRTYFGSRYNAHPTLSESLGWDELIAIRGLKHLRVEHIIKRKADRRTDEERRCLENMLCAYLLRPASNEE